MSGITFADSPLEALAGADAAVLVTEWRELLELDWQRGRRGDGRRSGDRRAQRAGPARPSAPPACVTRGSGGGEPMQAVILVGGAGHPPAAAHLERPQAGRAAGRPAVHLLHARVAARARRRGRDHVLRLPGRARAQRAGRRPGLGIRLRYVEEPEPRGTAGAVKLAEPMLEERFLMLNGDVLTDIDLERPARPARGHRRPRDARAGSRRRPQRLRARGARRGPGRCTDFVEKPSSGRLATRT